MSAASRELEQQRNLEIKRQLDEGTLVPVRVNVSQEFRQFLRLSKSKKSGRIFVPLDATGSVDRLRTELERQLGLPAAVVQVKAKRVSASGHAEQEEEEALEAAAAELIADDDALRSALATAAEAGVVPKLLLSPDPAIEWPPVPDYMRGMPDPAAATVSAIPRPHVPRASLRSTPFHPTAVDADDLVLCVPTHARSRGAVRRSPRGLGAALRRWARLRFK